MSSFTDPRNKILKISVFKIYVSQFRISLVRTGSDAVKHLLSFFRRLSDEIGPGHTPAEHLFFLSKKRRIFFISWAPDHYIDTFERGVKGRQIGILNSMRVHQ